MPSAVVIGGGLAGCEAAFQIATRGVGGLSDRAESRTGE